MKNKIHIAVVIVLFGFMSSALQGCSPLKAQQLSAINFDEIIFLSRWTPSGKVQLKNGEYRIAAAPGSASEIVIQPARNMAVGEIEGKEAAAVILVTHAGGSGTFYDLALLIKEPQQWINTDVVYLGDRVIIHSLAIENEIIGVELTKHGPDDPMCCPSRQVIQRFVTENNRLIQVTDRIRENIDHALVGTLWKWQQTLYNNDTKTTPPDPIRYTLKLLPGGRLSIRADCNSGGGIYTLKESRIALEITHSTMAACLPDSLENQFIQDLNAAAIYFIKADHLYIDLEYDTGTMKFSK